MLRWILRDFTRDCHKLGLTIHGDSINFGYIAKLDSDAMAAHGITYYSVGRPAIVTDGSPSRQEYRGVRSRAAVVGQRVFVNLDSRSS